MTFEKIPTLFSVLHSFVLANSVYPDEMLHNAAFHLHLHCLQKNSYLGFFSLQRVNVNMCIVYKSFDYLADDFSVYMYKVIIVIKSL